MRTRAGTLALLLVVSASYAAPAAARVTLSEVLWVQREAPELTSDDRQHLAQLASRAKTIPNPVAALFVALHSEDRKASSEAVAWSRQAKAELLSLGVPVPMVIPSGEPGSAADFGCPAATAAIEVEILFEDRVGRPASPPHHHRSELMGVCAAHRGTTVPAPLRG